MGVMFARPVAAFPAGTGAAIEPVTRFASPGGRIPARIGFIKALGRYAEGPGLVEPVAPDTAFLQDVAKPLRDFAAMGPGPTDLTVSRRRLRSQTGGRRLRQLDRMMCRLKIRPLPFVGLRGTQGNTGKDDTTD